MSLLYPFYLDSDMSMAFAAALTGGVALETETKGQKDESSQAVRNLKGNLNLFRGVGAEGSRQGQESSKEVTESTLVRRHTEASIFIDLFNELRRTGQIKENPAHEDLRVGDIVAMQTGPAIAPLRRVVDQVLRLIDAADPQAAPSTDGTSRQQRRQKERVNDREVDFTDIRRWFAALRDDLARSGMLDIAVSSENRPGVLLTLNEQFVTTTGLELLHTTRFTVVGKVTQIWTPDDEPVMLYRRSAISLVPVLAGTAMWGLITMLFQIAQQVTELDMESVARAALGMPAESETQEPADQVPDDEDSMTADNQGMEASGEEDQQEEESEGPKVSSDAIAALNPVMEGPAVQILPLALCV